MVNPSDAPPNETCIVDISVMRVINPQEFCRFGITSKGVVNGNEVENLPVACAMHGQTKANRHDCYFLSLRKPVGGSIESEWISNFATDHKIDAT